MTEVEWRNCKDTRRMLVFLENKFSERKARRLACSIGRLLWPFLGDDRSRRAVEVAEQFADGQAIETELVAANTAAGDAVRGDASRIAMWVADGSGAWQAARVAIVQLQQSAGDLRASGWPESALRRSQLFMDCIFGNPFQPAAIDPHWLAWNDWTVVKLAKTIYEDRRWEIMSILADALEDATCTNRDILDHCRGPGPHVRGCWVVDLILGKE